MNLPQIIRQARKDANLTQDQIAQYLGFAHRSNVQRLETGKLELKAKHLLLLANLLDLDLNSLKDEMLGWTTAEQGDLIIKTRYPLT